jgi:hypothetical protein
MNMGSGSGTMYKSGTGIHQNPDRRRVEEKSDQKKTTWRCVSFLSRKKATVPMGAQLQVVVASQDKLDERRWTRTQVAELVARGRAGRGRRRRALHTVDGARGPLSTASRPWSRREHGRRRTSLAPPDSIINLSSSDSNTDGHLYRAPVGSLPRTSP